MKKSSPASAEAAPGFHEQEREVTACAASLSDRFGGGLRAHLIAAAIFKRFVDRVGKGAQKRQGIVRPVRECRIQPILQDREFARIFLGQQRLEVCSVVAVVDERIRRAAVIG